MESRPNEEALLVHGHDAFSSTLKEANWENSELADTAYTDVAAAITELKQQPGDGDLALFGNPTFTASLLQASVVDEVRVMVNPILLGGGVSLYSGNVLLCYTPEVG